MGAFEDLNDNVIKLAECVIQLTDKVIALEEKVENGGKVIWTRKELAEYLDDSLVVADYYIHQPDFPKDTGGTKRKTFFCKQDAIEYIRKKANENANLSTVSVVPVAKSNYAKGKESALYVR